MLAANAEYDTFVLSFPKCGRTWHRLLVGFYLTTMLNEDPRRALELSYLCSKAGLKRLQYTHNGSNPTDRLPTTSQIVGSPVLWRDRDVLVLVRDPCDVMVSAYHHVSKREFRYDGTLSEFIREPTYGIAKYLTALNRWYQYRHLAKNFTVVSYESMHQDPAAALRQILELIEVTKPDEKLVGLAVNFTSFDKMRGYESENYFNAPLMSKQSDDPDAAKVRIGRVGSSRDVLSPDDLAFIDAEIIRLGMPFDIRTERADTP